MGKVPQVSDNDLGQFCRESWNKAMETAETDSTISGDGTVGNELAIVVDNTPDLSSNSPIIPPSVQALKLWASTIASQVSRTKSYSISRHVQAGRAFLAGFYFADSNSVTLTNASPSVMWGEVNNAYSAHAFIVSAGDGVTDGSDLILTVKGTSIDDNGVRTPLDSEVIVLDAVGSAPLNAYLETPKKWIGEIEFELTSTGGTVFQFTFNYGFAKYDDFNNTDIKIVGFEAVGLANKDGSDYNVQLIHHQATGWTYASTNFEAGSLPAIADMRADLLPEGLTWNDEYFAYKRSNLNTDINGADSEGFLIVLESNTNDPIDNINCHVLAELQPPSP